MQLQLTWQLLLMLPFLVIAIFYGWRRGWREEGITTVVLLGALLFFGNDRLSDIFGLLINRIVAAFAVFFSALFGRNVSGGDLVTPDNQTMVRFIGFSVFVALAYIVGGALGQRRNLTRAGRALGSTLAAINIFLIASQLFGFIQRFLPDIFQQEGTIRISPDADGAVLRNSLPSLFALLLIILLIVVFLRLPKTGQ